MILRRFPHHIWWLFRRKCMHKELLIDLIVRRGSKNFSPLSYFWWIWIQCKWHDDSLGLRRIIKHENCRNFFRGIDSNLSSLCTSHMVIWTWRHLIFQIVLRRRGTFIRCDQSALRMIDVFVAQENILQNCNITLWWRRSCA